MIKREDTVKAVSGHFKGKTGWVSRVDGDMVCVVWDKTWEHGIWVFLEEVVKIEEGKE